MASVSLQHVEKAFANGVRAVDDLTLHVADGEFVVLVGPSGCGKTTTLRMIAGLEMPTRGSIVIGGRVVNRMPPKDRNVAMVFQSPALYPHMTVRGNMAFPLLLRKVPGPDRNRRVSEVAGLLGIEDLLDRKPQQLSGGQQQRVALGRAIVREPACFLFDEPLAHLDPQLRLETRAEIKRLRSQLGATILYVTHDQEEAMTLGDRLAVMRQGQIQQVGSPLDVFQHPANRFVAGFIGSPPMNFLEGTIVQEDGRLWFDQRGQRLAVPARATQFLGPRVGARVALGIRPEAVSQRPIEGQMHNALTLRVGLIEPLGDKADVHLAIDRRAQIVARLTWPTDLAPGSVRQVYVDLDRLRFFDVDDPRGRPGGNLVFGESPKSQYLFSVEAAFTVAGRGTELVGFTADQYADLQGQDRIVLRRPDGSIARARITGVEYPPSVIRTERHSSRPKYGILVDLAQELVPVGAEVWLVG